MKQAPHEQVTKEGMTFAEIGKALGMRESNVRRDYYRAMEKLRRIPGLRELYERHLLHEGEDPRGTWRVER